MKTKRPNSCGIALGAFFLASVFLAPSAQAVPVIWEPDFGPAIDDLTGEDDYDTQVSLSFVFPFVGNTYNSVAVGTNGGLQLGDNGYDGDIDYDIWNDMDEFFDDEAPAIFPFSTDLSLYEQGTINFKEFNDDADPENDRAVFTWNGVGSYENEYANFTFQVQLFEDGTIIFGYDALPEDLEEDLSEGIVVGISLSDGPFPIPAPSDFSAAPFIGGDTIYQVWCYDDDYGCDLPSEFLPGPLNNAFDLRQANIIFTPVGSFEVRVLYQNVPEPGMLTMLGGGLLGLGWIRRRRRR